MCLCCIGIYFILVHVWYNYNRFNQKEVELSAQEWRLKQELVHWRLQQTSLHEGIWAMLDHREKGEVGDRALTECAAPTGPL